MFKMFKNKSVLTQTLLAVSVPLVVVFLLILFFCVDVVRKGSESFAREIMGNFAEQVSIRIEDRLAVMYTSLNMARRNLEALDYSAPSAREDAGRILRDMLLSAEGVYSSWMAFEPGAFGPGSERVIESLLKSGRYARESRHITSAMLADPAASPWYDYPLRSGSNYFVSVDRHDYGAGEGPVFRGTLTFPVKRDGVVIGCIGVDILYRQLLNFLRELDVLSGKRTMALITEKGEVVYSTTGDGAPVLVAPADLEQALAVKRPVMSYASSPDGGRVLICVAPVNTARASVRTLIYIELPSSALLAGAAPLVRNMYLSIALCFALLGTGMWLIMRGIVRPVKDLTAKADAIAAGDHDVDFGVDSEGGHAAGAEGGEPPANELKRLRIALRKMFRQLGDVHELKLAAVRADAEREKMAEAGKAKSRFFASMSHEIRTPMNAIVGLSEMLLAGGVSGEDRAHVQDIKISAAALLRIINDILDTSRMEEGRLALKCESFNLPAMLDNVSSVVALMASRKGLEFKFYSKDLPECVMGDSERLRQILLNILSNAVKYTQAGKVAFIAVRVGDRLRFTVSDTGSGIRPEDLPHVFNPYQRTSDTVIRGIEGTGLGLAITRQLVELMGGTVTATSNFGKGSVFEVNMPFEVGGGVAALDSSDVDGGGERWDASVLVVDDNAVNLKVACGFLRMFGIEAETASSGAGAVEMAGGREYDLIFMDHMMPGMDGVEAMRRIRGLGGWNGGVPIIALTANVMASAREMLLGEGMDDFLSKPMAVSALRAMLGKWLPAEKRRS